MSDQQNPALAQWQQRFDVAVRAAQDPRRPGESPQQFQQRKAQANQALRQLQMSKPTGTAPKARGSFGQPVAPKQPQPAQKPQQGSGGGFLGAIFNPIIQAMRGSQ